MEPEVLKNFLHEQADDLASNTAQLWEVASSLATAYSTHLSAQQELREAEREVQEYLDAYALDLEFQARAGAGVLAGLAKTSSAYKTAVDVAKAACEDSEILDAREHLSFCANQVMVADANLHREKTYFSALRSIIEGTSSLLRALAR